MGRLFDHLLVFAALFGAFVCLVCLVDNPASWRDSTLFLIVNLVLLFFILKTRFPRA